MILYKSKTRWGGGAAGRITGNCAQGGSASYEGSTPTIYITQIFLCENV